jgi:hypothetical protein
MPTGRDMGAAHPGSMTLKEAIDTSQSAAHKMAAVKRRAVKGKVFIIRIHNERVSRRHVKRTEARPSVPLKEQGTGLDPLLVTDFHMGVKSV